MRLGVLSEVGADIVGTISGGTGSGGGNVTYGLDVNGNTLACPAGYPYDPTTKDCIGANPADVTAQQLQADMDACTSGGGTWNLSTNACVSPAPPPGQTPPSLIAGIPNAALYVAGGLLLFALVAGKK